MNRSDISEMLEKGVINGETARRIERFYADRDSLGQNRQLTVFAIIGAILTGLGLILIIAHNWDSFSRPVRTAFAFLPLILTQLLCAFVLFKKTDPQWREASSVLLFFSVGAVISLVGQIYNMYGNLNAFLLTWMLLSLPLIYIMRSGATSLLYLAGITFYGANAGYWTYGEDVTNYYWALLIGAIPYYYALYDKNPNSNFTRFHDWMLPLSVTIVLGSVASSNESVMFIAYMSLFAIFFLLGNLSLFQRRGNSVYTLLGSIGTACLLLAMTFEDFWESLRRDDRAEIFSSPEFVVSAALTIAAVILLLRQRKSRPEAGFQPPEVIFLFFIPVFIAGLYLPIAAILMNLMAFAFGVLTIRKGMLLSHLGILNYGLLILAILVLCRFFDTDLSFVVRGIVFIVVGAGFFAANRYLILKRRKNE